jgi:hypothetical protein
MTTAVYPGARHEDLFGTPGSDLQPDDVRACLQYVMHVLTAEDIKLAPTP